MLSDSYELTTTILMHSLLMTPSVQQKFINTFTLLLSLLNVDTQAAPSVMEFTVLHLRNAGVLLSAF